MTGGKPAGARFKEPALGWGWTDDALCRDHPHSDWWISENKRERRLAAEICDLCPVGWECLTTVLGMPVHQRWNVWGGHAFDGKSR